ncbi:MerR family transcriptional regulator [Streptomyces aidingensis]|uniref:DNA-binding transcriptional regulator, MerR family n=1 Tax=Streptomyces aidingensis TaxID=910347 RepID=A0A1I1L1D3_9ACTN|nr:MerR family transcriptional regulator [Streptomyces aidingensis]SFC66866.1 DNA-binding transcriptional regulator, MerR family [Streptomyces aidingensis]
MTVTDTAPTAPTAAKTSDGTGPAAPDGDACVTASVAHPRPDGQDHYTISEVAALTGLSAHTLRWYERIGLMPHIDRSHTGQRRFRNQDLNWLEFIGKLRLTGMPVADMVRYAELVREGDHTFEARQDLLRTTRDDVLRRIAELQDALTVLDYKIRFYGTAAPPAADPAAGTAEGAGTPARTQRR